MDSSAIRSVKFILKNHTFCVLLLLVLEFRYSTVVLLM